MAPVQPILLGLITAAIGVAAGLGGFTFLYADGASYLTNNPAACANCHVMREVYEGWQRGSHHAVATCNDCHTPAALVPKYLTKGLNGYHHSLAFTSGNFYEPIRITERNRRVTEGACRHCHAELAQAIEGPQAAGGAHAQAQGLSCIRCHDSVGHLH